MKLWACLLLFCFVAGPVHAVVVHHTPHEAYEGTVTTQAIKAVIKCTITGNNLTGVYDSCCLENDFWNNCKQSESFSFTARKAHPNAYVIGINEYYGSLYVTWED